MKKLIGIICCCLLLGCQSQSSQTADVSQSKEDLVNCNQNYSEGSGNEKGYYSIKNKDDNNYSNIYYYDYETKQEVYLCNKPECQHLDETCTSFLMPGISYLYVYNDHIYIANMHGIRRNTLGEWERTGSRITRRNLDGSDDEEIFVADAGIELDFSSFVFGDNNLYLKTYQAEKYELEKDTLMQVDKNMELYVINLESKESKKLINFDNKDIVGAEGRNIIIKSMIYKEDPSMYLEKKDFQTYDKIMREGTIGFSKLDIDTLKETTVQISTYEDSGRYHDGKMYMAEEDGLYAFDIETGEVQKLVTYSTSHGFIIDAIIDDYIFITESLGTTEYEFISSYVVSMNQPEMKKVPFATRNPREPIRIIERNSKSLLVRYDREGQVEKTWAGTDQYEVSKEYIGLISKEDFIAGKENFQPIQMIE